MRLWVKADIAALIPYKSGHPIVRFIVFLTTFIAAFMADSIVINAKP